jgi:ubiquinone biosynthesis protein
MATWLTTFRELGRLRQIYIVLVRHGFGEIARRLGLGAAAKEKALPKDATCEADEAAAEQSGSEEAKKSPLAERVRRVAMDLGPSFVKLGQIASTRADVLPREWIVELKKLQDEVNPLPFEEIKIAVEASLGAPLEDFFDIVDEKPLAAASIGQVHAAKLKRPEGGALDVVLKVQRPGVRSTVARDLELLHHLAKLVERTIPESSTYSPAGLVEQFDRAITNELDFVMEAENAERFARNFDGYKGVRFPKVYKDVSGKQVLTLEFLPGKKVYDAIKVDGFSGERIAKHAVGVIIKMIFEDGFFHADPHPGNILISGTPEEPVLGLVDLGMVGRLSPEMRERCIDMMVAAGRKDHEAVADALYRIGTPTRKVDMRAFRAEVALLSEKYLGKPLKEIELAAMIGDLVGGGKKFGLEIPPEFLMMGKAIMTIEGVGKEIYPDLDVFGECKPFFIELLKRRYSPERLGNELWRGIERVGGAAYDLPNLARDVLEEARLGRLTVNTTDSMLPNTVDRLGRRIYSGFVTVAFVTSGTWLITRGYDYLGTSLLGFGIVVMLTHVFFDLVRRWK